MAIYSTSTEDLETTLCFFDFQETKELPTNTQPVTWSSCNPCPWAVLLRQWRRSYEISKHQFHRTRAKYLEVINGIVAEQYKILWDCGKELKRTNPDSTVQIEGSRPIFKRCYMCLGACKECFRSRCRLVIWLDGYFLKNEQDGQLLDAVGIDGDNYMFPVAWAVMNVEKKRNWEWFIELLIVGIVMYNSRVWTFISNKQKGLVDSINLFYEGAEYRCCAWRLYSNFTLVYKGLILKNLFWYTTRAATVS